MRQYIPVLILALLLTLASYVAWDQHGEATRYKGLAAEANTALVAAQARTALIQAKVQQADKDAAKARLDLRKALDAYPIWRDTVVPVPVYDSLCNTLRCDPASGVPSSGGAPKR